MSNSQSLWHSVEKAALLGNKSAIIKIVSALRLYRHAADVLLNQRYSDGELDAVAINEYITTLQEIEYNHTE